MDNSDEATPGAAAGAPTTDAPSTRFYARPFDISGLLPSGNANRRTSGTSVLAGRGVHSPSADSSRSLGKAIESVATQLEPAQAAPVRSPDVVVQAAEQPRPDSDESPISALRGSSADLVAVAPLGAPSAYRNMQKFMREIKESSIEAELKNVGFRYRSKKTAFRYVRTARSLIDAATRRRTDPEDDPHFQVSLVDVAKDLIKDKDRLAPSTWDSYKYALIFYFNLYRKELSSAEEAYGLLVGQKSDFSGEGEKAKTISKRDLNRLTNFLAKSSSDSGVNAGNWINSTVATGLRVIEWSVARWNEEKSGLIIENAKLKLAKTDFGPRAGYSIHDIERNNPGLILAGDYYDPSKKFREVPVDIADREVVGKHLEAIAKALKADSRKTADENFNTFYNTCRSRLEAACKKIFTDGKSYSFKVGRAQYAANRKAVVPLEEVVKNLGQSPDGRTAKGSYGRRAQAHRSKDHAQRQSHRDRSEHDSNAAVRPREKP